MKMTFRWYGADDPVSLEYISQIPTVSSIVSAVYDVPVGEVWSRESIKAIRDAAEAHRLTFEVVESVPVSEDIKLGTEKATFCIENYIENIRRLSFAGVKCICYNFMPVFDWLRSELNRKAPDGSRSLAYDEQTVLAMNPLMSGLSLPGWDESYSKAQLRGLLCQYENIGEEKLWHNLTRFLEAVIPVAHECGVNMAIHPDDPPWSIFGLPRIITNENKILRLLKIVDMPENGLTFCTGSLGASPDNNLPEIISKCRGRIHFAHIRNIMRTGEKSFHETAHPSQCGSLDMYDIVKALNDIGFDGYIRPDHGRMIWGESGRYGYGLYDRALGASYITGLWEAVSKNSKEALL